MKCKICNADLIQSAYDFKYCPTIIQDLKKFYSFDNNSHYKIFDSSREMFYIDRKHEDKWYFITLYNEYYTVCLYNRIEKKYFEIKRGQFFYKQKDMFYILNSPEKIEP